MASKIYENSKNMSSLSYVDEKETWEEMTRKNYTDFPMPVIAKGNVYQGIAAQW